MRKPLIALIFFSTSAYAQPQSRLTFCLNLAHAVQTAIFQDKKKYLTSEDELRKEMISGCAALRYETTIKPNGGFRVAAEHNGEVWSIDDKRELMQLFGGGKNRAAGTAPGAAAANPVANNDPNAPIPRPTTIDRFTPPPPGEGGTNTALGGDGKIKEHVNAPDAAANFRMQKCFEKKAFNTETCVALFNDLEKKCTGDDVPLIRQCLELENEISQVNLATCLGAEENFGKCELRKRQLEKRCSNQLRQNSSECRGLTRYLASLTPESTAGGTTRGGAGASGDAGSLLYRPPAGATVKALDPTMRLILRLRPALFEIKDKPNAREMGFVPDEVEIVNSSLVTYSSKGQLDAIKYTQFPAMLTRGLQELHGMCRENLDLQKDLINRLTVLEQENKKYKDENSDFKKQLLHLEANIVDLRKKLEAK